MKYTLLFVASFLGQIAYSQCNTCYSLTDALVDPSIVKELILVNQGLIEIPSEMKQMNNLEFLDLSQNNITEIGTALDQNLSLVTLDLSNNVGLNLLSASESFFQLPVLKELDLEGNRIVYLNPNIGELKSLEKLNLADNNLKSIPQPLSELPKLTYLNLANNHLEEVHMAFADFWQLQYLDIAGNFEKSWMETFLNLKYKTKLKTLRCNAPFISKSMALCLNTTGLEELIIVDSEVESIHSKLTQNKTLKKITFENSTIENPATAYRRLNSIRSLEELRFDQTAIDPAIKGMSNLNNLSIEDTPVPVDAIAKNKSIRQVSIQNSDENLDKIVAVLQSANADLAIEDGRIPVTEAMRSNTVQPIVEVEPMVKTMDPSKDNVLTFKDTECAIQKETFLDANGQVYKGEVKVEVTEYFDPIVNALAGAPMTAQNEAGGDEIFASNGMINFSATGNNGEELTIDPAKPVSITIRDVQPAVQSNLFLLQPTTNTWTTISTPQSNSFDSLRRIIFDSLMQLSDDQFASLTSIQPEMSIQVVKSKKDPYSFIIKSPRIAFRGRKIKNVNGSVFYYSKRDDMRYISRKTWTLDTVRTEKMDSLFKLMNGDVKNTGGMLGFYSNPRLVRDAVLVPDLEHDNYRLQLVYRGDSLSFPVYFQEKGNVQVEQNKQAVFYRKYKSRRARHLKFEAVMKEKRAEELKKAAKANKEQMATFLTNLRLNPQNVNQWNSTYYSGLRETLSFGITLNGFYNCDYFSRIRPIRYDAFPEFVLDNDGEKIELPETLRYVILEDNAYFELNRKAVPVMSGKKTLIIMVLSAVEIAVITSWEFINGKLVPKLKRINTEDKTPEQIRTEIFQP